MAEKKYEALRKAQEVTEGKEVGVVTGEDLEELPETTKEEVQEEATVVFKPNPGPQTDFLAATEDEVFYGGARGGGKSYAMLVDPLRDCDHPQFSGLLLRRTMPELRDMIQKSQFLYKAAFPGAQFKVQENTWYFPSGARIEFGYAENLQDALRYQGREFQWIGVDELPQYASSEIWHMLRGSCRAPRHPDPRVRPLKPVMRATGNPGNIGSRWVKEDWIDRAPSNTRFYDEVSFTTPDGEKKVRRISKRYIPATVWDNPYLTEDDAYVATLASLPETMRKQWLEGDWDVFEGAAFPEFRRDVHVCKPFPIPAGWTKFRGADYGYTAPACVLWFAVDWDGRLYVYRELYRSGMTADVCGQTVLAMEEQEFVKDGVLDSSCWHRRGDIGPSIAETMIKEGCRWRPADRSPGSRVAGKLELHRRLALQPTGEMEMIGGESVPVEKPGLIIFDTCINLIKTLGNIPLDKNNPEDVDTNAEDHAYDALRYGIMSRPWRPRDKFGDTLGSYGQSGRSFTPADPVFGY